MQDKKRKTTPVFTEQVTLACFAIEIIYNFSDFFRKLSIVDSFLGGVFLAAFCRFVWGSQILKTAMSAGYSALRTTKTIICSVPKKPESHHRQPAVVLYRLSRQEHFLLILLRPQVAGTDRNITDNNQHPEQLVL